MDEVRKSWWSSGLHLADSLRVKNTYNGTGARFSRAWKNDSISLAKGNRPFAQLDDVTEDPQPPRILGMRKRNFYINLTVVSVLLLAFLAMGIFLGLNKTDEGSSTSALYPGLTVSSSNRTQANIQIFYQNTTTSAIHYRVSLDLNSYSEPRTLRLNASPNGNISMSVTSFESEDFVFHQLFYVMNSKIAMANISCPLATPSNCSTFDEKTIGTTHPIAKNSTIAAVHTSDGSWQLFYHNAEYNLSKIACTNGTWETNGVMIGNKAVSGSGIAAVTFGANAIEVLYIDETGNGIFAVEATNGQWSSPSAITTVTPTEFSNTSRLALSYTSRTDSFLAYYTGLDSQIYAFMATNASSAEFPAAVSSDISGRSDVGWTNTPSSNETWVLNQGPGAPVASTTWLDQVVFFQIRDGSLIQTNLNSTSRAWDVVVI